MTFDRGDAYRRPGLYTTKRAKFLAFALVAIDVLIIAGVWTGTVRH